MGDRIVLDGELSLSIPLDGEAGTVIEVVHDTGIDTIVFNADYTLTFNMTNGETFTTGSIRGEQGETGAKGEQGDIYVLTEQDKEDIANMVNAPVTDVQVDGTSVVNNGVANIVSTVKELREYAQLGEDTDLIVIPLPEKYEKIWFRFRCRINNSENTLPNSGTAQILAWLGNNPEFKENGDTSITETAQITTSNVFLIKGWYIFDFPYLDRFSVGGSKTDTNYASFNVKQHGARVNVKKFTSYPKFLYIRPLTTDAGYLFKANSSLAVYAK